MRVKYADERQMLIDLYHFSSQRGKTELAVDS
jgi:hypothetical protein